MAEALLPPNLARLIEGGRRALEHAQKALDYLFGQAQDKFGLRGETLVHPAAGCAPARATSRGRPHCVRRRKLR
jgi:hypothetical protein